MVTITTPSLPAAPSDRVQRHTAPERQEAIDQITRLQVQRAVGQGPAELSRRIQAVERTWDVERTLELNASTLALTGTVLGLTVHRRWFWLPTGVMTFLLQHALTGWCPPVPVFRRLGVRTRGELDQAKYALKALRGDFAATAAGGTASAEVAWEAAGRGTENLPDGGGEPDRVRRVTPERLLRRLDAEAAARVREFASQPEAMISARIDELYREWSIERYLQVNVATIGASTALLAYAVDRRWAWVTLTGLGFFLTHAVQGFDPPVPWLRARGVRTRREINREIYALKVLRGDFAEAAELGPEASAERVLRPVGL